MDEEYQVEFWEDKITRNEDGQLIHHPLNSLYKFNGADYPSYGYLTFCGHDLDKSQILSDLHVYYLEFFGEENRDREAWADNLRVDVLKSLCTGNYSWYLGVVGSDVTSMRDILMMIFFQESMITNQNKEKQVESVIVDSEKMFGSGKGFLKRTFFEVPRSSIERVLLEYLPDSTPGWPIEGYCMAPDSIHLFEEWNKRERDDKLCKDVLDQAFIAFYTFPSENRYFVFLTNKLMKDELTEIIHLESLREKAKVYKGS
jgi:hypothetical protein